MPGCCACCCCGGNACGCGDSVGWRTPGCGVVTAVEGALRGCDGGTAALGFDGVNGDAEGDWRLTLDGGGAVGAGRPREKLESTGAVPRLNAFGEPVAGVCRANVEAGGGALTGRCTALRVGSIRTEGAVTITGAVAKASRGTRTRFCCTGWRVANAVLDIAMMPPG